MDECFVGVTGRRKVFWATQPDCSTAELCDTQCGVPGLKFVDENGTTSQVNDLNPTPVTISNENWVRGLVLNILMTNGREEDRECGFRPGQQGGHWTDSYRTDNHTAGSLIRQIPTNIGVSESTRLIGEYAKLALSKLIDHSLATEIKADATYVGNGVVKLDVVVTTLDGDNVVVGATASSANNFWAWSTTQ